jgi:hypothetical protein
VYAVIYLIIKQIRKNSAECWVQSAEFRVCDAILIWNWMGLRRYN